MPEFLHVLLENSMALFGADVYRFSTLVFWMFVCAPWNFYLFIHIYSVSIRWFETIPTTHTIDNGG